MKVWFKALLGKYTDLGSLENIATVFAFSEGRGKECVVYIPALILEYTATRAYTSSLTVASSFSLN